MADSTKYGNAPDYDVELHSIYAAYIGLFESSSTDWWDKSWGNYFTTFNDFLGFGWEVMVVVDSMTGRAHIAVRREQIALFAKMIRTSRFGESLPKDPPTTLPLNPIATRNLSLRRLVTIHDLNSYRKLSHTLPSAELSYLRSRVRAGEVAVAEQLFYAGGSSGERDTGGVGVKDNGVGYTFACVKTTWWEKGGHPHGLVSGVGRTQAAKAGQGGKGLILEVGVATLRCANLRAVEVWPPVPEENYRKSHYIVEEWVDKRANISPPNYPRAYGFGTSRFIAEKDAEKILDANVNALASQENDGNANTLILLTLGDPTPLPVPASSTLPSNILHLDVLALEFNLLRRAQSQGLPGMPDRQQPLHSLGALLHTLQIPIAPFAPLGNAGNDAYYTLLAFQKLMMGETRLPEMLFRQPEPYMNGVPYPAYSPFPHSSSMQQLSNYPMLPPPPPIPAAGRNRRDSSGSRLLDFPNSYPSSPSSGSHSRRVSELPRPRPASMGDSLASMYPRRPTSPDHHGQTGSAPSTVRAERKSMVRSQTVFWDDQTYAQMSVSDQERDRDRRDSTFKPPPLRPDMTGGSSGSEGLRGRSEGALPPSALRSGMHTSGSSRSISWEGNGNGTNGTSGLVQPGRRSRAPSANAVPTSGTVQRDRPSMRPSGSSSSNLVQHNAESTGTGSSTKLSTSSSGDTKTHKAVVEQQAGNSGKKDKEKNNKDGHGNANGNGNETNGGGKSKLKSEKSVKDIAGALARFWVG
ncbi:hypothetical protein I316_05311 [Kwoniella heveanensis BCC8398]|uniref:Gfd2/YDR514C-like C-terminal domain-containing protein n=1 Tax=Kwoniella heveanensis BCC8398 TaxID=1296120 RepID=A0A1B9GPN8_9TREE|nr:hypothetical protein I316_05311 [Kwoniella heveanensis BCC8398]